MKAGFYHWTMLEKRLKNGASITTKKDLMGLWETYLPWYMQLPRHIVYDLEKSH